MHGIPHAFCCCTHLSVWREEGAICVEHLAVLIPPFLTLCFPLCISVTSACVLRGVGAHGWVVRFCQPSVQSPSWSWLPIVEAPGCLRHPTSTQQCSCLTKNKTQQEVFTQVLSISAYTVSLDFQLEESFNLTSTGKRMKGKEEQTLSNLKKERK